MLGGGIEQDGEQFLAQFPELAFFNVIGCASTSVDSLFVLPGPQFLLDCLWFGAPVSSEYKL